MPGKQVSPSLAAPGGHSAPEGACAALPPPRSSRSSQRRVAFSSALPSRTKQEFAQEADINFLMGRYLSTGVIPPAVKQGYFADVDAIDYQTALGLVHEATALFDALPSAVRERFGNNPAALMDFVADSGNREEALRLGLIDGPTASVEALSRDPKTVAVPTPSAVTNGA